MVSAQMPMHIWAEPQMPMHIWAEPQMPMRCASNSRW